MFIQSLLLLGHISIAQPYQLDSDTFSEQSETVADNPVINLIMLLKQLETMAEQPLLESHFRSVRAMIEDQTHDVPWTKEDSLAASEVLTFFQNEGASWETYSNGPRPLIMNFKSPSDGKNTFYWLFLPKYFDPGYDQYPFYIELHGSGGGKNDNPRNMLFRPLQPEIKGVTSQGYRQEGLFIYPWGRGDKWYKYQAALDIHECLEHFDNMFETNTKRQYLYGFSMGGTGVLNIAQTSKDRWTALGIYSGAFMQGVNREEVEQIKQIPVWITWGDKEPLAEGCKKLRDYLLELGTEVKWQEVKDVGHAYLGEYREDLMNWFGTELEILLMRLSMVELILPSMTLGKLT